MPRFVSTRGGCAPVSFEEALLSGYAPDGGLFMPQSIPSLDAATLATWAKMPYPSVVEAVLAQFVDEAEVPRDELGAAVMRAFSRFDIDGAVQLRYTPSAGGDAAVGAGGAGGSTRRRDAHVAELWHGPTLAFKDLALQVIGQLLELVLAKRRKHVTVLVGTSGDTGSAAIEAVRGLRWADIIVLYPGGGRVSDVQERQMVCVEDDNVHVSAVDGTSDDLDVPIKKLFEDAALVKECGLISINSINVVRILVQTAHYFWSAFRCRERDPDRAVTFAVPTGAAGHITAGQLALAMGLPRVSFVVGVNDNDVMHRFLSTGNVRPAASVRQTVAPAMDINMAYNVERLLWLVTGGDSGRVREWMDAFEADGHVDMPSDVTTALRTRARIVSTSVNKSDILRTIARVWDSDKYLVCPHTAVAAAAVERLHKDDTSIVIMATAHPYKFEAAVAKAFGADRPGMAECALARSRSGNVDKVAKLDPAGAAVGTEMWRRGADWEENWTKRLRDVVLSVQHRVAHSKL